MELKNQGSRFAILNRDSIPDKEESGKEVNMRHKLVEQDGGKSQSLTMHISQTRKSQSTNRSRNQEKNSDTYRDWPIWAKVSTEKTNCNLEPTNQVMRKSQTNFQHLEFH